MRTSSAKAKGRRLQNWVCDELKKRFGFTEDDARVAIMGEAGADVKLSARARNAVPIKIECKNHEAFANVYKAYEQAASHEGKEEPVVFIKRNRHKVLVILDANYFLELVSMNVKR